MFAAPLMSSWLDLGNILLILVAALVAAVQLRHSFRTGREVRAFEARGALERLSRERERIERAFSRGADSAPIPIERVKKILAEDATLEDDLTIVLDQLEMYCLAVTAQLSDEDIAFEMSCSTVIWYGSAFAPFIEMRRATLDSTTIYVYLTHVTERWADRIRREHHSLVTTGEPYFARRRRRSRRD